VHGYALMTNHYHLLATPEDARGLPRTMKELGGRYVNYFNRKHQRIGTLWNGRYRAIAITDETYWLTCLRYVEQNPVRAQMVRTPEMYPWSSYRVHALGAGVARFHRVCLALGADAGATNGISSAVWRAGDRRRNSGTASRLGTDRGQTGV
jgi:hypothetical protein